MVLASLHSIAAHKASATPFSSVATCLPQMTSTSKQPMYSGIPCRWWILSQNRGLLTYLDPLHLQCTEAFT